MLFPPGNRNGGFYFNREIFTARQVRNIQNAAGGTMGPEL
jgi:hypothetical protein